LKGADHFNENQMSVVWRLTALQATNCKTAGMESNSPSPSGVPMPKITFKGGATMKAKLLFDHSVNQEEAFIGDIQKREGYPSG
jgi:hypothetical protein